MERVELRPSQVKEQIESGMKRSELAEFYGLSMQQMAEAINEMGLKGIRAKKKAYVIINEDVVDDMPNTVIEETQDREMPEAAITEQSY